MTEPLDTYDDQGDYDWDYDDADDRGPRPKILWGRVISLVAFMLIAFLIGRWSVPDGVSQTEFNEVSDQVDTLQAENEQLSQDLADAQAALQNTDTGGSEGETDEGETDEGETNEGTQDLEADTYTVQSGDTLSAIIKKHYGCTVAVDEEGQNEVDLTENVTDTNIADDPGFDPTLLSAGQDILLPPLPTGYECP